MAADSPCQSGHKHRTQARTLLGVHLVRFMRNLHQKNTINSIKSGDGWMAWQNSHVG